MGIIRVTKGIGQGLTALSAFDAALQDASISNYNLIPLSSVIPLGYELKIEKPLPNENEFGYKLYVVIASQTEDRPGVEAWAGIGWVMREGADKGGLFVEHHGGSKYEVIKLITDSLTSMKSHRSEEYGEIKYEVSGAKCLDKPVCALVAAVYKSEGWK